MFAQVLQFSQHGDPTQVLHLVEQKISKPAAGQVLVRMQAAAINPSDRLHIEGAYGAEVRFPARVGFEGVGVVESSGGGLLGKLTCGKRVAVLAREGGTWGTSCVVGAKSVFPVPATLSDEQVALFFINPATAFLLTQRVLQVPRGSWIMQSAGASAVGRMVIALGQHFGFRTLSLVRREEQIDELKALGGDAVVLTQAGEDAESFREQVDQYCGEFPKCAIDAVGGSIGSLMAAALGANGRLICYGTLSGDPLVIDPRQLMLNQSIISSFWLGPYMQQCSLLSKVKIVANLKSLHKRGVFQLPEVQSFPLEDYQQALRCDQNSTGGHKVVLRMN